MRTAKRSIILMSVLAKLVCLLLILPFVMPGFRWVLILIFGAAITAQLILFWKLKPRAATPPTSFQETNQR